MSIYVLKKTQILPISMQKAWEFLSSPYNLSLITPPDMSFEIKNDIKRDDKMFAGQIIVYRIGILPFIKSEWVSEITQVVQDSYFIDEQRSGPYAFWHHLHKISLVEGGVKMEDVIHYRIPFGLLGKLLNVIFIRKKLESIFSYRFAKLEQVFGKFPV